MKCGTNWRQAILILGGATLAAPAAAILPETGLWAIDAEVNGQPGRGFQLVAENGTLVVTAFGYGSDGAAQWYLASGSIDGASFNGQLEQYSGGTTFGGPQVSAHRTGSAGAIKLSFSDSRHARVELPGESVKSLSRFDFDGGATSGVVPESGLWAISAEVNGDPGRGFQLDIQGSQLVMTFYGYGADGASQWYLAAGPLAWGRFSGDLQRYAGGTAFGGAVQAASPAGSAGSVSLYFDDSSHGWMTLPGEAAREISRFPLGQSSRPAFTMAQTLSDQAQRTTLAFAGLGMMTGNLAAQSFFPPGKVADYTGFQYLRDNDPDGMGHNTSFLTRVANNVIYILSDAQFDRLRTLASDQLPQIDRYGYLRYPLMAAFRRLLEGDLPAGSSGLNLLSTQKASRELYLLDGQISFERAAVYAEIIGGLGASQRAHLEAMRGKGWNSWPDITDDQIQARMKSLPRGTAVAVMTYASDLYSWYAGSVDADAYFCPERHGTYFGAFYMKDAPAIGHEGYSINEQLTATAGEALSNSARGYVTAAQAATMASLVERQRENLYAGATANIVQIRTEIARQLRSLLLPGTDPLSVRDRVLELSALYGELDGANNHAYATVFAEVHGGLSTTQKSRLASLRKSILSGTYADGTAFDFTVAATPFLYSEPVRDATSLAPYIDAGDVLFFAP